MNKHIKNCIQICNSSGLHVISFTKNKHIKIKTNGGLLIFSSTPSNNNWKINAQALAKKLFNDMKTQKDISV